MKSALRGLAWLVAAMGGAVLGYLVLALVLGLLPVNRDFRDASDGVAIWLRTNGVHADLVLPVSSVGVDWRPLVPGTAAESFDWVALGWGDRAFYLQTPTWRELRPGVALAALLGAGPGAMHVEPVDDPAAYHAQRIVLNPQQYRALARFVSDSFARDGAGAVQPIAAPGFFGNDRFFKALPRYSMRHTCNEWVRQALAAAGVRTARWAPFEWALRWQLDRRLGPTRTSLAPAR